MDVQEVAHDVDHREILVEIRTWDDRSIGMTKNEDGNVSLSVNAEYPQALRLTMMDPDLFALRTPDSLEWLTIEDDGRFSLQGGAMGSQQIFQLVRSADMDTLFGFRFVSGDAFLGFSDGPESTLSATASDLDTAVRFTFAPIAAEGRDVPEGLHAGCCGPIHTHTHSHTHSHDHSPEQAEGDAGLLWDEHTHFRIVEMAVHYLRHMENPTPEASLISDVWTRGSKKIAEGLKGADEWDDWKPTHPIWASYYYHFYNPRTGTSFPWPASWYPHNAVSKGGETFDTSVRHYREGRHDQAFIDLGLSLHYLTDLCQPMHAANFINDPLDVDWRHSGYESYAEDFVKNRNFFRQPGGYPPIRRDEIEDTSPSARAWLTGVAWQSLGTWENGLRDVCDKKFRYVSGPWGPIKVWVNTWTAAEADNALMASLWLAPRNTARYLCMWANRVR